MNANLQFILFHSPVDDARVLPAVPADTNPYDTSAATAKSDIVPTPAPIEGVPAPIENEKVEAVTTPLTKPSKGIFSLCCGGNKDNYTS